MQQFQIQLDGFEKYIQSRIQLHEPESLYEPVTDMMELGGKRIRPLLTILAAEICGNEARHIYHAALAVEVFHNFTLLHDDIMDNSDLRRGKPTIHKKYNINTAILSGDLMSIQAFQYLAESKHPRVAECLQLFFTTAIKICEGQQWDMEFETSQSVSKDDYLRMIEYKTAVLLGCSLYIGAALTNIDKKICEVFYDFGKNIGMAFQVKDDLLDTFGDEKYFGKPIGKDIQNGKKTILYHLVLEKLKKEDAIKFKNLYNSDETSKIEKTIAIFEEYNILTSTKKLENFYIEKSNQALFLLEQKGFDISPLRVLSDVISRRTK